MSDEIYEPPHNDDAERALLGAALIDIAALDEAVERLESQDFYRERHRHVWRAMRAMHAEGVDDIDMLALADRLSEMEALEAVGGPPYLTRLSNDVPSAANAETYIDLIERTSRHREALSTLGAHYDALQDEHEDVGARLDELLADAYDLSSGRGESNLKSAQEMAESAVDTLEDVMTGGGEHAVPTGFVDVDQKLDGGLYDANLIVIAGRPGMGKTSLIMNMMQRQSVGPESNVRGLFASLEMSNATVSLRHIAGLAGVSLKRIRRGTVSEDDWRDLTSAAPDYSDADLYTDDTPAITPQTLRAKARRAKAKMGGLDVVYIDYLQLMSAPGDHGTREQEVADISSSLKEIAKDLDVPVVVLAQLNRGVERRDDKRPKLKDLRESGAIEQDADVAGFLYREAYYDEESNSPVAELIFRKNRHGSTGTVRLRWNGPTTSFEDLDERHEYGRAG